MNGILILAHGSRKPETERILESLVSKLKIKTKGALIESAYLQFSEPSLEKGVESLIKLGALDIRIIPLFLFDGIHVTQDIPEEIETLKTRHPGIRISLGRHLGDDDRIVDIMKDRIDELDAILP